MTTRDRTMNEIMELNPTASRDFLSLFDEAALAQYRDHLVHANRPGARPPDGSGPRMPAR